MQGLALTTDEIIEILSAYSAPTRQIDAVAAAPGWQVFGALRMPVTFDVQLVATGCVANGSLTMTVRLYCIAPGFVGPVSGSELLITSTTDLRSQSGIFSLAGARDYQYQAQVVGGSGDTQFGIVESANLQGAG